MDSSGTYQFFLVGSLSPRVTESSESKPSKELWSKIKTQRKFALDQLGRIGNPQLLQVMSQKMHPVQDMDVEVGEEARGSSDLVPAHDPRLDLV